MQIFVYRIINKTVLIFLVISCLFCYNSKAQGWVYNFDEATQMAREKSRNILLVFSGSDWCAPCIKLQKEILETSEFQSFAEDHFVLLKADFPRKKANQLPAQQKEHNNKLAEKYNQNGYFPLVVMLDGNGRLLGETGYKNIPTDEYIAMLEEMEKE